MHFEEKGGQTNSELPLVSVVMLAWNRKDDVRESLKHVFESTYPNLEVIVVDNASTDGTPKVIKEEFPEVKLIKLPSNIGIEGFNLGFAHSSGEYIVVLDDDSYPYEDAIEKAVAEFLRDSRIGVVAFKITDKNEVEITNGWREVMWTFWGCGFAVKKAVIKKIGGYEEMFFLYANELEFSMRVYSAGYYIRYLEDAIVKHNVSSKNRSSWRHYYFSTRNRIWTILLRFPLRYIPIGVFNVLISGGIHALRDKNLLPYLKGCMDGIAGYPRIRNKRQPVPNHIASAYFLRYRMFLRNFLRTWSFSAAFRQIDDKFYKRFLELIGVSGDPR